MGFVPITRERPPNGATAGDRLDVRGDATDVIATMDDGRAEAVLPRAIDGGPRRHPHRGLAPAMGRVDDGGGLGL
jgi:hypothetical protein